MPYPMNHIHLRSKDPHKAVQWYEKHFGFDVPDLAKELERLEKENVRVRLPMTTLRGTKLAYIEGPDDVLIELVEAR